MPDFLIHIPGLPPFRLARGRSELRIGRSPDQDIILEDPAISRTHAKLSWKAGAVYFEDLGSRHGCFVNGTRLQAPTRIHPPDALGLGPIELRLEEVPSERPAPAPAQEEEETQSLPVEAIQGWGPPVGPADTVLQGRATLDLFFEVSLLLLKDQPTDQLLEDLLARLFVFLKAGHGSILVPDQTGELLPLATRALDASDTAVARLSHRAVKATAARREAMWLKAPAAPQEGPGTAFGGATSSAMAVPLEHAGEVLGLFYFDTGPARPFFSEDDLRIVASLGNLAATRIIQHRLSEALRHKQDLERELQVIEAADQAKGEFLAHMSHEMRTPMNAILGFLHLAQDEDLPPTASDYLLKIEQSGRSLVKLLDDVLDLSKIEARKLDLESRPFRLEQVLRGVEDLLGQTAKQKALSLTLAQGRDTQGLLLGDPLRLRQVLLNLVGNALKFTEQGGILVGVERLGTREGTALFRFSVKDTGIGMSASQLARIFAPFTQAEPSTTRRFGGTGLGLTISKRLVALLGGDIWVESSPGLGSQFQFTARFPLAPDPMLAPETTAPAPPGPGGSGLADLRVLVVEDNAISRELTSILLRRVGIRVDLAANGLEAVALASGADYHAIVMDLEMPELDGLDATRRIRSGERNHRTPILAFTAHALASHRARCLDAGMNDCLTKPLAPELLYEALQRWAGTSGGTLASPLPATAAATGQDLPLDLQRVAAVVDVPLALGRLDGQGELLVKFLRAFAEDPVNAQSIRAAMAAGHRTQAASLAHGLKGMADTLAVTAVAATARELEQLLLDPAVEGWEPVCDHLEAALQAFRDSLRAGE